MSGPLAPADALGAEFGIEKNRTSNPLQPDSGWGECKYDFLPSQVAMAEGFGEGRVSVDGVGTIKRCYSHDVCLHLGFVSCTDKRGNPIPSDT